MKPLLSKKRLAWTVLVGVAALNLVAYQQAHAFTHFAARGHRTRPLQFLPFREKIQVLVMGAELPRPENRRTPRDLNLEYERRVFAGAHGVSLEAWLVPQINPRGTVVLFHGHAASKDAVLREAKVFHGMGFRTLLVDFYGSGGSGGNETSIGFHEAIDVREAFDYSRDLPGAGPVLLYGVSMGAAAILKGVADGNLEPAGLILECPFDSLIGTVRHRFTTIGIPSFPMADLLVFWGGVQEGFNAFGYRPVVSASRVKCPTLLMSGAADPWVKPEEARAIFAALRGPKTLRFFPAVGHDSCLRARPDSGRTQSRGSWTRLLARRQAPETEAPCASPETPCRAVAAILIRDGRWASAKIG